MRTAEINDTILAGSANKVGPRERRQVRYYAAKYLRQSPGAAPDEVAEYAGGALAIYWPASTCTRIAAAILSV